MQVQGCSSSMAEKCCYLGLGCQVKHRLRQVPSLELERVVVNTMVISTQYLAVIEQLIVWL